MIKKLSIIILFIGLIIELNAYNYGKLENNIKGCDNNIAKSCKDLAHMYLNGTKRLIRDELNAEKLYAKTLKIYKDECNTGNGKSCYYIAFYYLGSSSYNIDKNLTMHTKYNTSSCVNDYSKGCFGLAQSYASGEGVTKDKRKSLTLYKKSLNLMDIECNNEIGNSCDLLGYFYTHGLHVKVNQEKITEYYQKAFNIFEEECNKNISEGCMELATMYLRGKYVEKDYIKSKDIFKKACILGDEEGCNRVYKLNQLQNN